MISKVLKSVFCEPPYPKCEEETMVEVVRCKDCIKWTKLYSDAEYGWCTYHSQFDLESTRFDDYCSKGVANEG